MLQNQTAERVIANLLDQVDVLKLKNEQVRTEANGTKSLVQKLFGKASNTRVIDGGLATQLETGYQCNLNHKLWSSLVLDSDPELITKAHADFIREGARMIVTCTYQGTLEGFEGDETKFETSIDTAVKCARRAADQTLEGDEKVLVAGSCGSYGASLCKGEEYSGAYPGVLSEEEWPKFLGACASAVRPPAVPIPDLVDGASSSQSHKNWSTFLQRWHRRRSELLIGTHSVDLLAFETVPRALEGAAASELLRELQFPGYVTFSCRDEKCLGSGELLETALRSLQLSPYLVGIGINCTSIKFVTGLVTVIENFLNEKFSNTDVQVDDRPRIVVYPNSGECYDGLNKTWAEDETLGGKSFGDFACDWHKAGARVIGGCCRVFPKDICEVCERLPDSGGP
jgi:homocysteine S-methyltransferase